MPQDDKRGKDPHLGLSFWVEVDGLEVAGFAECSGLQVEIEVFEYAEGGLNDHTHKLPVRTKYGNITLKRGMDPGQDLYQWFLKTMLGLSSGKGPVRKNVTISIYGPQTGQAAVQQWNLREAFPVKWTGPDLKTDAGAVAIETIEFAHAGLVFSNSKTVQTPDEWTIPVQ